LALKYINLGEKKIAMQLLRRCEQRADKDNSQLLSLTFNNLSYFYQTKKKPLLALNYLHRALEIELGDPNTPLTRVAQTKLNICAVLSSLGKHELSKDFALGAIQNLKEAKEGTSEILDQAYYNLGVELEHLKDYEGARSVFA